MPSSSYMYDVAVVGGGAPCMPRQATQYPPGKCSKSCKNKTPG